MVTVVVVEFGVMRCQPLRRALSFTSRIRESYEIKKNKKTFVYPRFFSTPRNRF
ncbi:acetyltransferase [Vibrio paracholerae]|uniref:Acetyltransferase n=1 Tax=Vibrio paracholerae TaxID=650003 RepID=A0ABD7FQ97_9VIBR|nr:acetyltransferase [Vibrio paracholerae]